MLTAMARRIARGPVQRGQDRIYKNLGDGKLAAGEWLKTGGVVAEVPGVW
jgi:hypothetical protein